MKYSQSVCRILEVKFNFFNGLVFHLIFGTYILEFVVHYVGLNNLLQFDIYQLSYLEKVALKRDPSLTNSFILVVVFELLESE